MQSAELLKKVRKLEIVTSKMVEDVMGGAYHSVFKGRGIEFDEVREYTFEDDVRDIDWNVSARLNAPYVKKYVEERELTVLLMLDTSASMQFGIPGNSVAERAIEVAALLGLSAIGNHDRVGLSLFSSKIDKFLSPRGGRHHNLRLIRELVSASQTHAGVTDIAAALRNACGVLVKRSVIFVISDLLDDSQELETALKIACRRHDVIVLHIYEPAASQLPPGLVNFYDAESGEFIQLKNSAGRAAFAAKQQQAIQKRQYMCRLAGAEVIAMPCDVDMLNTLRLFFQRRRNCRRSSGNRANGSGI